MSEFKQQQEIAKGQTAKDVLDNEVFKEAFSEVERAIIQKWRDCPIRDHEGQHELKLMLKLLEEVRGHIESVCTTGKMAQIEFDRERERKERLKKIPRQWGDTI